MGSRRMLVWALEVVLCVWLAGVGAAPPPPDDAVPCPYPAPEDIEPCNCVADPRTFQGYVMCYWTMGQDPAKNMEQFNNVLNQFDTFNKIFVMEMTCDECSNFVLDGYFNENTTGRFEISYFTLEHFDPSEVIPSLEQFSETSFKGSRESLLYLKLDANHFFTPATDFLLGMTGLQELQLHGLDSMSTSLPALSPLSSLRLLSLSEGSFPTLTAGNFAGLEQLMTLFIDNSQVETIAPDTFMNLTRLNQLSLSFNKLETLAPKTFSNLPNLSILNLGNNLFQEIAEDFSGLSANTLILLHNNKFRILSESTFRNFVERVMKIPLATGLIDLDNNPLECGCDVKWIVSDLKATGVMRNARCANGIPLAEVDPEYLDFFCP